MPDTNLNTKTIKLLREELSSQNDQIKMCNEKVSELTMRLSKLIDENSLLESQISRLQETVSQDIKYLYEKVN